jgi:hypothetical protein
VCIEGMGMGLIGRLVYGIWHMAYGIWQPLTVSKHREKILTVYHMCQGAGRRTPPRV